MITIKTEGFNPLIEPLGVTGNVVNDRAFSVLNVAQGKDKGLSGLAGLGCSSSNIGRGMAGWTEDIDWNNLLETGVKTTGDILRFRYGPPPPGTTIQQTPYGTSMYVGSYGSTVSPNASLNVGGNIGSLLPLMLLGIGAVVIVKMLK